MADPLVIIGAGGFGRETADVVEAVNATGDGPRWNLLGIVDDAPSPVNLARLSERGIDHLGSVEDLLRDPARPHFLVGIGAPAARRSVAERLEAAGLRAATVIHPDASVGTECLIGDGTVVLAGARVTTNVRLGRHVHLNPNATVGHDTVLDDFVSLNPAASVCGDCVVGPGVLIGVGAAVLQQRRIGAGAVVGAAACVLHDVAPGAVVKGVPAR